MGGGDMEGRHPVWTCMGSDPVHFDIMEWEKFKGGQVETWKRGNSEE